MSLQPSLTSRRQFLERSMLGFGSAFLLPSLLTSCTDHIIDPGGPGAGTPGTNPPLLGDVYDWNADAKNLVVGAIEMVPIAGDLLGAFVECLWPDSKIDVWGQIRSQVENLIDQKIDETLYNNKLAYVNGIKVAADRYTLLLSELVYPLTTDAQNNIFNEWKHTESTIAEAVVNLQVSGYELLLMPLFAQVANMHIIHFRDLEIRGFWDWLAPGNALMDYQKLMAQSIDDYTAYIHQYYDPALATLKQNTHAAKKEKDNIEPFKTVNNFERQMGLMVLSYMDMWPYLDFNNPISAQPLSLTREIYSDPYGTAYDSGPIKLPANPPTQFPTNVTVWSWDRVDAVQLTYPSGTGPDGVTTTARMGDQPDGKGSGGSNQPPHGDSFNLTPDNPIYAVRVTYGGYMYGAWYGPLVSALEFEFKDGTTSRMLGSTIGIWNGVSDSGWQGWKTWAVSSIHINGFDKNIGSADLIVIGYQTYRSVSDKLDAVRQIYIASPQERSEAELAKAHPKVAIPAGLVTEELKAARKKHWEAVKARVK